MSAQLTRADRVSHDPGVDYSAIDLPKLLLDTESAGAMKAHGSTDAAVLMPISSWPEKPRLTFTERRADLRKHAGEISFPGGTTEPEDRDLEETALRESEEEIALHRVHVDVVGAVPPVGTFATSFRIQPIVGLVSEEATMVANPDEVAAILTFGFDELLDSYAMRRLVRRGVPIRTPTFEIGRHLIWGATARILTDFFHRIGAMR
jgi:8-oxo-dGTP pyrophosphatase MutT (NUDIX family)